MCNSKIEAQLIGFLCSSVDTNNPYENSWRFLGNFSFAFDNIFRLVFNGRRENTDKAFRGVSCSENSSWLRLL